MIGVFDSGFGGLTVLKAFLKVLPEYDYVYLGDGARAPYGDKSRETIYNYTEAAVEFLFKNGCELVIIACNTASADALRSIQQDFLLKKYPQKKVLGVIVPIAEELVDIKKGEKIGLIGTQATINSGAYDREINRANNALFLYKKSCPLLVPLIEEGWDKELETEKILQKYLFSLKKEKIKYLILGCTHYPLLKKQINKIMGKNVKIFNTPEIIAKKLKDYLSRHKEINKLLSRAGRRFYFTTDDPEKFKKFGARFLGKKIHSVKKVQI